MVLEHICIFRISLKESTMKNFNELDIENKLKNSIKYSNFITPTPIQSQAIPIALEGKDNHSYKDTVQTVQNKKIEKS